MTSGVKVELELSPEGATQKPFAAISINHLRIKEANGTAERTVAPQGEYKDNLQLNIKEHINLEGFLIAGGLASYWPTDIYVLGNAKLDLANANNNGTEIYLALKLGHLDTKYKEEYLYGDGMPLELCYKNNTLTVRTDGRAYLLEASGAASLSAYDMLLSGPIGNLIDKLLSAPGFETAKAEFDARYWKTAPDAEGKNGAFNMGFQGLTVKNIGVKDVINMIGGALTAPKAETSEEAAPAASANYYKLASYILGLISSHEDGKLTLTSKDGLLGTIGKVAELLALDKLTTTEGEGEQATVTTYDWNKAGLIDWAVGTLDPLIKGFTGGLVGASFIFAFDGVSGSNLNETFNMVFEEAPDAIQIAFDFTKGLDWDIKLGMHEDPGIAINWTSRIRFGEATPLKDIKTRLQEERDALKEALADERGELQEGTYEHPDGKVGSLIKAYEDALKVRDDAQKAYNDSALKKAYDEANATATTAKNNFIANVDSPNIAEIKAMITSTLNNFNLTNLKNGIINYLNAKYVNETEPSAENAAEVESTKAKLCANFEGQYPNYRLAEGKTTADVVAAADALYNTYKTDVAAKQVLANQAQAANEASPEYIAKQAADADVPYKQWRITYARQRLAAYELNLGDTTTFTTERAAYDDAVAKDAAYNAARKEVDDIVAAQATVLDEAYAAAVKAIDDVIGEDENKAAFDTALKTYFRFYVGNQQDSAKITAAQVEEKKTALDAAKDALTNKAAVTDALITAALNAYIANYNVTISGYWAPYSVSTENPNANKFANTLKEYLQNYAGNKQNSEIITAETVTSKLDALKALITTLKLGSQLTDAKLTALAEAYAAAYEVTINETSKKVTAETAKLTTASATFAGTPVWYEIDFAA